MAKKTRLQGDPALAKPHAAGATAAPLQTLTHDPLGAIGYPWSEFWIFEARLADESFDKLKALHESIAEIPPDTSNIRHLRDKELLKAIYQAGTDMVSHATRSVQHLAECMERVKGTTLRGATATERIREAVALFGLSDYQTHSGYQGFAEILKIRDAVEHPTEARAFQPDPTKWDEVPLAWLLSDRSLKAFERHSSWFQLIVKDWDTYCKANLRPRTFQILIRGLKSVMSAKKPPKRK